jgi:A/G-specific adenine glycosylase
MTDLIPDAAEIAPPLLAWFDVHGRDLPWRGLTDLYAVWVSEIILQQTRVETGLRYFAPFLERFPTVRALAEADEAEVLAAWSGLGFYRRARNLHAGARRVVEDHGGEVPSDPKALGALPGVGRYTVGAILSSALDQRLPILDGNVIRVLSRLFLVEGAPDRSAVNKELWALAEATLPARRPGDFNQALMDLGATVCTPTSPRCEGCPLVDACGARAEGRVDELPFPKRKSKVVSEERVAVLALDPNGRFLVRQRPAKGLLASLWELPSVEADGDAAPDAADELIDEVGGSGRAACGTVEHRFSHRHWTVRVYRTSVAKAADGRWVTEEDLKDMGVPTASMKAIRAGLTGEPLQGTLL